MTDGPKDTATYEVAVKFTLTFDTTQYLGMLFAGSTPEQQEEIAHNAVVNLFDAYRSRRANDKGIRPGVVIAPVRLAGEVDGTTGGTE